MSTSSVVRIAEGAVVCDSAAAKPPYQQHHAGRGAVAAGAMLMGDITIGPETVVFPGAEVRCCEGAGPVVIGRGCVLEEGARLVNSGPGEMRVGDGNLFEVGCTVHAQQVDIVVRTRHKRPRPKAQSSTLVRNEDGANTPNDSLVCFGKKSSPQ